MNERLSYLADLLESGGDIPPASRQWLLSAFRAIESGVPANEALSLEVKHSRQERNDIIKVNAQNLGIWSTSGKARILAAEARRLHRGRRSEYPWIARADTICKLPESVRQYHHILK